VVLTGLASPLQGGDLIKLNLTFAEAGTIAMTVPVQPKAYEYATFSPPATPSPAATKKGKAKAPPRRHGQPHGHAVAVTGAPGPARSG
jgi:hypothetical protein